MQVSDSESSQFRARARAVRGPGRRVPIPRAESNLILTHTTSFNDFPKNRQVLCFGDRAAVAPVSRAPRLQSRSDSEACGITARAAERPDSVT